MAEAYDTKRIADALKSINENLVMLIARFAKYTETLEKLII